jgi:hypothetical protein
LINCAKPSPVRPEWQPAAPAPQFGQGNFALFAFFGNQTLNLPAALPLRVFPLYSRLGLLDNPFHKIPAAQYPLIAELLFSPPAPRTPGTGRLHLVSQPTHLLAGGNQLTESAHVRSKALFAAAG